jgi:predicted RNA binding protein YcfA (HicA-like mRNA interferase family)
VRQKGSHLILARDEIVVPIPKHKEIKRGLLLEIIAEAGLTKEEFMDLLEE